MNPKHLLLFAAISVVFYSCGSAKKLKASEARYDQLLLTHAALQGSLKSCEDEKEKLKGRVGGLESQVIELNNQMGLVKDNGTQALQQLEFLSVISKQQAESIKQSLDNIGAKDNYIMDLQQSMARKDSLNMALVNNLKGAIGNLDDQDINIKVEKGVVFIDISDKLLFGSGQYDITRKASAVLAKVAMVLKNQPELDFMVEGHTDNRPYKNGVLLDNWDLSVKRATSVARILQKKYGLSPAHIVAAGRAEFQPLLDNSTAQARASNRRTRIVVLPQLDQFFQLLEKK